MVELRIVVVVKNEEARGEAFVEKNERFIKNCRQMVKQQRL